MTDVIDTIQFSEDRDSDERDPEDSAFAAPTGGGPAKAHKPFPLMKLMGGIAAAAVVLIVGAVGLTKVLQPKATQDQFSSIPQPQVSAAGNTQSVLVQIGTGCAPNGLMGQSAMGVAFCQGGVWTSGQAAAAQSAQSAQMQPPLPQGQFATPQPQAGMAQVQQPMAAGPNAGVGGQYATPQQAATNEPNPVGPVPHRAGPGDAVPTAQTDGAASQQRPAATGAVQAATGDVAAQLAAMQATIAELQKQLAGKSGGVAAKVAGHAKKEAPKAVTSQASADEVEQADSDANAAPSPHRQRVKHAKAHPKKAANSGEKGKPDASYVVTGMIGTRAFIAKKGGNDVNPDSTVAVGDTLDDGRKVLSVDPKTKRVWLSGNQYISTGTTGTTGSDE
ncbi:hypothetical protein [Burkholderia ubonensis]|uniref:hypothetical protein n=1 Tax=Burkholderia ubonensis TaxID=101571 RepID=UPI000756A2AE|nr:hypothetical protein [Burkholderia ubonensis]KVV07469.1 hypothetical protein WK77_16925 [Burkholderia ubonensis]